ncbi:nitrogenase iron-molybdenum cofactor biosynthesis protein NifN [Reinekea marinisedimentorum]|uniref:Nitrogenase iron-molybdenum cofactor biosynthesis protein NifN n=1 Tax=Reinekea marinisedimentorum TaxID=230495 RepID=A0A4R3I4B8_9GAMM|nr:nitrogenase iron-molybdenum cofactor biosynthesis protein NifN [Reinekea marinisedimentorum]TCS39721.1 nitrogenase molybdenum-iron protein NifN [Reinekea marinisedimentorum]
MAQLLRNKKPLADRPLKTSQATGASLASMGIEGCIPLMHGSQGCGAFAKVFLIQHFREPMPIQNTAVDQIAAVMGADDNIAQALQLLCEKHNPQAITLMSTGLTELQGCDLERNVRDFYKAYPEFSHVKIITVSSPDFIGSLQSGFAATVDAYVKTLNKTQPVGEKVANQINVLCSSALTTADVEILKGYTESFGLEAIFVPDLSSSLDGHLEEDDFSPTSTGGCHVADISAMYKSAATFVIGESLFKTGTWLEQQFNIPCFKFAHLMGLEATDEFIFQLAQLTQKPVAPFINRARQRLQDSLLDTHFVLSTTNTALALESDLLLGFDALLQEAGSFVKLGVTATPSAYLKKAHAETIVVGDHSDLDDVVGETDFLIGNTHCAEFFADKVPVLRAGLPSHDRFGAAHQQQVGYQGARALLSTLGNLMLDNHHDEVKPFYSPYRFRPEEVIPVK